MTLIKEKKTERIKLSKEELENLVSFGKYKEFDLNSLSKDEIIKYSRETKFIFDKKDIKGQITYQFGKLNVEPFVLDLHVKPDYEEGHALVFSGKKYEKQSFLNLFEHFDNIVNKAIDLFYKKLDNLKKDYVLSNQINMFPELEFLEIRNIQVEYRGEAYDILKENETYKLKMDKKTFLGKTDLYFLYTNFDDIVNKLVEG